MANPSTRGSAPDRARPSYLRSGDFKSGHKKHGGRKRGTPNVFLSDLREAILEAACRIGYDGNGKDGFGGYILWIGQYHPKIFYADFLIAWLNLEIAEAERAEDPRQPESTFHDLIGLTATSEVHKPKEPHRPRQGCDFGLTSASKKLKLSGSPVGWTGQPEPVGGLMQLAVENPRAFCRLVIAAFMQLPAKSKPRRSFDGGLVHGRDDVALR
jgi:hypothetical protein